MGLLEWLMPPSIFNVFQTRLLDNEQGAQLEPDFRPALLVVDMQEDFCPPVSPFWTCFLHIPVQIPRHHLLESFSYDMAIFTCAFSLETIISILASFWSASSLHFIPETRKIVQWGKPCHSYYRVSLILRTNRPLTISQWLRWLAKLQSHITSHLKLISLIKSQPLTYSISF